MIEEKIMLDDFFQTGRGDYPISKNGARLNNLITLFQHDIWQICLFQSERNAHWCKWQALVGYVDEDGDFWMGYEFYDKSLETKDFYIEQAKERLLTFSSQRDMSEKLLKYLQDENNSTELIGGRVFKKSCTRRLLFRNVPIPFNRNDFPNKYAN